MTVLEGFKLANLDPGVNSLYFNDALGCWRTWDSAFALLCEEEPPFDVKPKWQELPEFMHEYEGEYNMGNMSVLDCIDILPSEVIAVIPDAELRDN